MTKNRTVKVEEVGEKKSGTLQFGVQVCTRPRLFIGGVSTCSSYPYKAPKMQSVNSSRSTGALTLRFVIRTFKKRSDTSVVGT